MELNEIQSQVRLFFETYTPCAGLLTTPCSTAAGRPPTNLSTSPLVSTPANHRPLSRSTRNGLHPQADRAGFPDEVGPGLCARSADGVGHVGAQEMSRRLGTEETGRDGPEARGDGESRTSFPPRRLERTQIDHLDALFCRSSRSSVCLTCRPSFSSFDSTATVHPSACRRRRTRSRSSPDSSRSLATNGLSPPLTQPTLDLSSRTTLLRSSVWRRGR